MNFDVAIINPCTDRQWDDHIKGFATTSIFHSSHWAIVLIESYRFKPYYFLFFRDKTLSAAVPVLETRDLRGRRKGICLPYSDFCEPLLITQSDYAEVAGYVIEFGRRAEWDSLEIRGGGQPVPEAPVSAAYTGHSLNLQDSTEDELLSRCHETARRNIKVAEKSGVSVVFHTSLSALKEFYRLNCITRKRHGLPPQPFAFFRKIHEHIIGQGKGFISLGIRNGKSIAGAFFCTYGKTALFKYGASDYSSREYRANNLVMWESIRNLKRSGHKILYLGRTDLPHEGLRRFKLQLGASEYRLNYFRYDFSRNAFVVAKENAAGFFTPVFRALPLPVLKQVGSLFYRFGA